MPQGFNPCQHVTKYKENKRETYLTGEQVTRLGKVLDSPEAEHPYKVRAVRLQLLTGCRMNEIRGGRVLLDSLIGPIGDCLRLRLLSVPQVV